MARRRGFSLVELLVVVAGIALLIALAAPALLRSVEAARDVNCRSNLRQTFAAQSAYAVEHEVFTPLWTDAEPIGWKDRLNTYMRGSGAMHKLIACPSAEHEDPAQPLDRDRNIRAGSVGLNGAMRFEVWRFNPQRVPAPGRIIALGEQPVAIYETALTADGYGVWTDGRNTSWYRAPNHDAGRGFRHGSEGGNYAMMDGHVARLPREALRRASGRWFWFDALANDTAAPPIGDGPTTPYQMPGEPTPNPVPTPGGGGGGDGQPAGPLTAPCGCPIPGT